MSMETMSGTEEHVERHTRETLAGSYRSHEHYIEAVVAATDYALRDVGVASNATSWRDKNPEVVLTPTVVLAAYKPPPHHLHPMTMIPGCIDLVSPNECSQYWGGGSGGGGGDYGGTLGPFGGNPGPLNLPGSGRAANAFIPALGALMVFVGKTAAAVLATKGSEELMNGLLKRYNVPWIQFKFRTGKQNAQPFRGAAPVAHGIPAYRWDADPDSWATI